MADPDNSQIDADIVDYLLGNGEDYSDYVSNTGAEFLSNIKLAPPDLGAPKTSSSVKGQSSRGSASVKASRQDDEKGDEYGIEEEQAGENDQLDLSNYNGVDKYDSDAPYDASVRGKKSLGEAVWLHEKDCVELLTLRGNYWRVMGWSEDRTMLLNPEVALLLVERGHLRVKASVVSEKHIP
ncbi:MAG: tRNA-splicing endonuclease subunit SEN54 family protein, partial [Actinomycetota bacterium]|nr:tRNA-splicing endonuclease subunit SEN54 family protein [Actinomycetota bacterium]